MLATAIKLVATNTFSADARLDPGEKKAMTHSAIGSKSLTRADDAARP
jgi:hypothetical protein